MLQVHGSKLSSFLATSIEEHFKVPTKYQVLCDIEGLRAGWPMTKGKLLFVSLCFKHVLKILGCWCFKMFEHVYRLQVL